MMVDIQIRRASQQDYRAVCSLLEAHGLPLDGIDHHLKHFLTAIQADDTLAGVVGLEPYGQFGLLRSVAVKERKAGLGTALVEGMIGYAQASGIKQLILLTTTASEYFPRFGFRTINRKDVPETVKQSVEFQSACPDTAVVMALDLVGEMRA